MKLQLATVNCDRTKLVRNFAMKIDSWIINVKVIISVLHSKTNPALISIKLWRYGETLILQKGHRLLFIAITDKHAGRTAGKSKSIYKCFPVGFPHFHFNPTISTKIILNVKIQITIVVVFTLDFWIKGNPFINRLIKDCLT